MKPSSVEQSPNEPMVMLLNRRIAAHNSNPSPRPYTNDNSALAPVAYSEVQYLD